MTHHKSRPAAVRAKRYAKSGTKKARKSIRADGRFISDLRDLGYFERVDRSASSVAYAVAYAPITLPTLEGPSKPKPWRDIHEEVRGMFFHVAMKAKANHHGFTLRLSKSVETLARGQGRQCVAWLHRRVVRQLRLAVGAPKGDPVPFWFAIEEDDKSALHLHGEISVDPHLQPLVREALKSAGGKWEGIGRGFAQLRFESNPDSRWAGYSLKTAHKARPGRRKLMQRMGVTVSRDWLARFEGKAVTASEGLKQEAIKLHASAVQEVLTTFKRPAFWGIF